MNSQSEVEFSTVESLEFLKITNSSPRWLYAFQSHQSYLLNPFYSKVASDISNVTFKSSSATSETLHSLSPYTRQTPKTSKTPDSTFPNSCSIVFIQKPCNSEIPENLPNPEPKNLPRETFENPPRRIPRHQRRSCCVRVARKFPSSILVDTEYVGGLEARQASPSK